MSNTFISGEIHVWYDSGATMLMVEQNLALAFKVADRFIILRDGLVSDGGFVKTLEGNHDEIVRTIYL